MEAFVGSSPARSPSSRVSCPDTVCVCDSQLTPMSAMNDALIRAVPDMVSPLEPPRLSGPEPRAAAGGENERIAEPPLEIPIGDSDPDVVLMDDEENGAVPIGEGNPDVVLVDYEENDPENPLNWSPTRKWLMVLAISWMGFVR